MTRPALRCRLVCLAALVLFPGAELGAQAEHPSPDPLADAISRWQERIRTSPAEDEDTKQIRAGAVPLLTDAERAIAQGKRWLALSRLALVWSNLEAADYRSGISGELRSQMSELEKEWRRLGPQLTTVKPSTPGGRAAPVPGSESFEHLPAAARAIGEAALAQVPVFYEASLDYGRNTAPEYGLFYLGAAQAQRDFARWIAALASRPAGVAPLAPRDLSLEIADQRGELLAVYQPPLSIDSHPVFIRISALLKEADELAEQGAHYGALFRLLDARARLSRLTHPGRTLTAAEAEQRGRQVAAELDRRSDDTSLQRLFLETALFSAAEVDPTAGGGEIAAAIFDDVLPYFPVLLGPAPARPPPPRVAATVTLIRWPYT